LSALSPNVPSGQLTHLDASELISRGVSVNSCKASPCSQRTRGITLSERENYWFPRRGRTKVQRILSGQVHESSPRAARTIRSHTRGSLPPSLGQARGGCGESIARRRHIRPRIDPIAGRGAIALRGDAGDPAGNHPRDSPTTDASCSVVCRSLHPRRCKSPFT
jgi:hypothetical protein